MFGIAYLLFNLTGYVINATEEYIYDASNRMRAKNNSNLLYTDRKGRIHLTANDELVMSHHQISMSDVKKYGLPVYCYGDTILTDIYNQKVYYNYSEVERNESYQKKLGKRKENESALLWTVINSPKVVCVPKGIVYKDCVTGDLYLKRKINKEDLVFYMNFENGSLVRLADESIDKYGNHSGIPKLIYDFNERQAEKAKWLEQNGDDLSEIELRYFISWFFLNDYEDDAYNFTGDAEMSLNENLRLMGIGD